MSGGARLSSILLVVLFSAARGALTAEPTFDVDVAPILRTHCQECHGAEGPKSGLKLLSQPDLLAGGESGPSVVPGRPDDSLLIQLIAAGEMPPAEAPRIPPEQVAVLRRWIETLPPATATAAHSRVDPHSRDFRAFRKLSAPAVPSLPDGQRAQSEVDAFLLARLQREGITPAPRADKLTLLRRACFDLLGLPPTVAQMDEFLADNAPDAFERLVDRLLATPEFGQRWGRHWLDAAGYSDVTGGDNDAAIIKLSEGKWKYRDWVVRALNDDMPYERFLVEQLAGDELVDWRAAPQFNSETRDLLVATGFLRNAADDTDEKELTTPDILNGVLQRTCEVVTNNLLGLTLACAKCHDHKYEPIPQQDYYRLLAAFTPTFNPGGWLPPKARALADIAPVEKAAAEKHNADIDGQVAELRKQQADLKRPIEERMRSERLATVSEPIRADVQAAIATPEKKRSEVQKYLAGKFQAALAVADGDVVAALSAEDRNKLAEHERRIAGLGASKRTWGTIQAAYEVGPPPETHLLRRGNHETPGPVVQAGFLDVLCSPQGSATLGASPADALRATGTTSGRRLALARWLTDWNEPAGGLAARVLVNRVWQHLFGRGIVETSENMGVSGAEPTHPELLEWLACQFVADGRRFKPLIKRLMISEAYQRSATTSDEHDPGNRLFGRMTLRRLEAEIVRDAMLAVSGQLDPTFGGPAVGIEVRPDGMVVVAEKSQTSPTAKSRRSIYILARRHYHLSMLGVFDQPAMSTNCPVRNQSAVVLQSLALLNDDFVCEQAGHFARRVAAVESKPEDQIALAFRLALGRAPTEAESVWSRELMAAQEVELRGDKSPGEATHAALEQLCHMLLGTNEFLYAP